MRWHGDRYRNARRRLLRKRLGAYLTGPKKRRRRKLLAEIYSAMFWDSKIAPVVEVEMQKGKPATHESFKEFHSRRISTMIRVRNELWKNESDDIVAMVKNEKKRLDDEMSPSQAAEGREDDEEKAISEEEFKGDSDEQTLEELKEYACFLKSLSCN